MPDDAASRQPTRIALLIDADNISPDYVPVILREAAVLGTVTLRRLYGSFSSATVNCWQEAIDRFALSPVLTPTVVSGKNATDLRMAIDAMDLLYSRRFDAFCIASSDSDFTSLAIRIREEGVRVIGFGARKAKPVYASSCDRFHHCDVDRVPAAPPALPNPSPSEAKKAKPGAKTDTGKDKPRSETEYPGAVLRVVLAELRVADDWPCLSTVGSKMREQIPGFDPKKYGYSTLSKMLRADSGLQLRESPTKGASVLQVSLRPQQSAA